MARMQFDRNQRLARQIAFNVSTICWSQREHGHQGSDLRPARRAFNATAVGMLRKLIDAAIRALFGTLLVAAGTAIRFFSSFTESRKRSSVCRCMV
jgi:hypothetical protein